MTPGAVGGQLYKRGFSHEYSSTYCFASPVCSTHVRSLRGVRFLGGTLTLNIHGRTYHSALYALERYKEEEDTSAHWNGNEAGVHIYIYFLSHPEVLYLVAQCQGSPVMKQTGSLECFPRLRWVCLGWGALADVSAVLSSSSLPVGQWDRDGSLSAGLWLDPSP